MQPSDKEILPTITLSQNDTEQGQIKSIAHKDKNQGADSANSEAHSIISEADSAFEDQEQTPANRVKNGTRGGQDFQAQAQ